MKNKQLKKLRKPRNPVRAALVFKPGFAHDDPRRTTSGEARARQRQNARRVSQSGEDE